MKKIKLSQVISKLEEKGLHKTAENVKKVIGVIKKPGRGNIYEAEDVLDELSAECSKMATAINKRLIAAGVRLRRKITGDDIALHLESLVTAKMEHLS